MTIIISEKGINAQKVESTSVADEDFLQTYIKNNPQSIPVNAINEDLRLLILAREFPTASGPIDALGIDQEGNIYVIETKLARNPDKRYVIAQVLDYGAALWRQYENLDEFIEKVAYVTQKTFGIELSAMLKNFIDEGEDVADLVTIIRQNLTRGELRFLVLMDHLDDRLRNLITFVNRNSQFTIYGVEMEFYKFDKYEILIPKLYGAEVTKESPKPSPIFPIWDESSFFKAVESKDKAKVQRVRELYTMSKENADEVTFREKSKAGRIDVKFKNISSHQPFYSIASGGRLVMNFNWLPDNDNSVSVAERFCEAVKSLHGFEDSTNFLSRRERQVIDFEKWAKSIAGFATALRAIKNSEQN
jgi:hypothetical protein